MLAEGYFHDVAQQVRELLSGGSVSLLLGCPESELRHPFLDMFPTNCFNCYGMEAGDILLGNEYIRALCDLAIQSGQVQTNNHVQIHTSEMRAESVAIVPIERPAGLLGLFLVTDPQPEAFGHGECRLLSEYLHTAAQQIEHRLRNLYSTHPSPKGVTLTETQEQKDEFISMVSHELRMPLTSIKGYAGLLQAYGITETTSCIGEMTPERQQHYLRTILQQADHLEVLIGDLLDMSRIHAGHLALHCTQVDIALLCRQAAELARQRVEQQQPEQYRICCVLPPDVPLAWADPDRVQQVLTNLVENAIKYSPNGGIIEILAHTRPAFPSINNRPFTEFEPLPTTSVPQTSPMIHVTIRDQGIGIPHEQLAFLFKPFSRLEHPAAEQVPGVGLGLYITRRLVEAMQGTVTLHSSEGEGTSVTFTLPYLTNYPRDERD